MCLVCVFSPAACICMRSYVMSACDALAELECSCMYPLNPESAPTEKQEKSPPFLSMKRLFNVLCSCIFERTIGADTYMVKPTSADASIKQPT